MSIIKKATPADSAALTALTKASKAFWGYTPQQIQAWEADLTITPAYIKQNPVYQLIGQTQIIGYYSYFPLEKRLVKLDNMFLLPDFIGKGYGNFLMNDFLDRVKAIGFKRVTLDAEPNAESFYAKFGFEVVGQLESSIKGRFLPIMILDLE